MTIHSDIDKIFKEGLKDYSEKTPSFIWDNIDQELNSKRNKRNRNFFYALAASVALLLSFGAGYLFTNFNTSIQLAENESSPVNNEPKQLNITESNSNDYKPNIENKPELNNENTSDKLIIAEPKKNISTKKAKTPKKKTNKAHTKVKKVSSSGTLLPPIFAENDSYEESLTSSYKKNTSSLNESNLNDKTNKLTNLELKQAMFTYDIPERDLVYEIRQLPMPTEPTTIHSPTIDKQWSIGISGTPLLSYRHIQERENEAFASSANTSGLQQNYENEKPLVSYSAGVNVNYQFANRWKIQSGFYMSETGQVINNIDLAQAPSSIYNSSSGNDYQIITSTGNITIKENSETLYNYVNKTSNSNYYASINDLNREGSELNSIETTTTKAEFIQTLEYYEIPVVLGYKLIDKKLDVNISGGVSANILVNNSTYLQNGNERQNINAEVEGIKSMNYSSILGFGFEYPIITQLLINLNPTFRYSINSVNEAGNVYPYSFGIYTGLKYKF